MLQDDLDDDVAGVAAAVDRLFDHLIKFLEDDEFLGVVGLVGLIALMLREGYRIDFVSVAHRPRRVGRSKYGVWDRLTVGISDLAGVMWLNRRFRGPNTPKEL